MTDGTVDIIIPTYYRNDRLRSTIESALSQIYDPIEVVVVDDSGEGHAQTVAKEYPEITYVKLPENKKAHPARGAGIEHSAGSYVQFLDDDDRLHEDTIERKVACMERSEGVGVVYSGLQWENGHEVLPPEDARGDILELALQFEPAPCTTSTLLVAREVLAELLPFTNRYGGADDLAMIIELARRTEFDFVDEPLTVWGDDGDEGWGASEAAIDGRKRILEDYSNLYEQFPPQVKQSAMAETYQMEGRRYLSQQKWSAEAIGAFGRALYFAPGFQSVFLVEFLSSLLGRPGRNAASWVNSHLLGSSHRS